ncbi:hypothetical protein POL68_00200 [Stigmatella sp. ncwal1]|uniref:Uncharacterized protein n=1 Tax=Stigmatella ashevillensis TaxID=2995309 RepID=A0ABT5CZN0_9BACT|nr:hypothetical protein [Stigmatella ashevillena]MDC0706885.1 hypothetical protein [Stigmatella ashevillena]
MGLPGAQGGLITRDEAYAGRVRLTLEQDEDRSFYALTCGIPEWLSHSRFFGSADEATAAFEAMRPALVELWSRLPAGGPRSSPDAARLAGPLLAAFVARFS